MLKIPSKLSIVLSLIISVMFFVLCIVGAFFLPALTELLMQARNSLNIHDAFSSAAKTFVHILAYAVLADVLLADALLFALLLRVKNGNVFSETSVALIRGVSWCCMALCGVFVLLGIYFHIAFIVAFAALFLGLCLRVVKNVIEQATIIKSENDLTV